jgi:hypothetical protein
VQFDNARDPYSARNALGITSTGGGGGGAPLDAQYITAAADPTLTAERVLTDTASITWDFSTPGQAKANSAAGGGNVSNSGTPTSGQYAKWVTATTIQGVAPATVLSDIGAAPLASPTFTGDPKAPTPATADNDTSIATTAYVQAQGYLTTAAAAAAYQPLDADLTAIAALTGTNNIYYRSAANVWSSVTIGTNLTFSGGTLSASGGGGSATYTSIGAGRLTYVSATALLFAPYNGNQIKINGTYFDIPTAGIAGLANTSVFVNGTGSSNLAASTVYWVYAFSNAGTVTADFRTASTHTQSTTAGNEGVEILTGNDSRSLIGLVRTNASSQFVDSVTQRFVRSWFNCQKVNLVSSGLGNTTSTSTTFIEIDATKRVEFVKWANELIELNFTGAMTNSAAGNRVEANIGIDNATPVSATCSVHAAGASYSTALVCNYTSVSLAEGYHHGRMLGAVGSNTGQWGGLTTQGGSQSCLSGFLGGLP